MAGIKLMDTVTNEQTLEIMKKEVCGDLPSVVGGALVVTSGDC